MSYSESKLLLSNATGGRGDMTKLDVTLCEAATSAAEFVQREGALRPGVEPRVNGNGTEELAMPAIWVTTCDRDTMEAEPRQQPLSLTSAHSVPRTSRFAAISSNEERTAKHPSSELEEELRCRLAHLEEWICELLIKNEKLRMTLMAAEGTAQLAGQT